MTILKITLLGLDFASDNLGCGALAYSFVNELSIAAEQIGIMVDFTAFVCSVSDDICVPINGNKVKCIGIHCKKLSFWNEYRKTVNESDIVFDFTGGDSFSDIYGKKRFYKASMMKMIAIKSKAIFVLGPQTYGPFNGRMVRYWAKKIIRKSDYVFSRDEISAEYLKTMVEKKIIVTTDVAMALPYEKKKIETEKIKVGFNPSGLLWDGGYSFAKINLKTDYQKYCRAVLEKITQNESMQVYLIPHVGFRDGSGGENDFFVCRKLHEEFPNTVVMDQILSPMDAKSIISSMDIFIGARMHATIAAFSSGVATIPFSYSRKFEGLFNNLGYTNVIHASSDSTEASVNTTLTFIEDKERLKKEGNSAMIPICTLRNVFLDEMKKILQTV